jgi:two-component system alkaline phosphatase synthesis response regulator PhoP
MASAISKWLFNSPKGVTEMVGGMLRKHVLVVEDAPSVRLVVFHYLQQLGMDVTQVESGNAALRFLEQVPTGVDALLIDLGLPDMSGADLARQMTAKGSPIFMSGRSDVPDNLPGPVLIKPFNEAELGAALELVLGTALSVPGYAPREFPRYR